MAATSHDSERRRRVEQLCEEALERAEPDRDRFLAAACAGDEALRHEVDALLAHERNADRFLSEPVGALAAQVLLDRGDSRAASADSDRQLAGRRIGTYQLLSWIGAGGMGEVYRARDTRLGLVYARKGSLLAVPFALDRLQVLGPPVVVLNKVFVDRGNGYGGFAIASNGSVVFAPGPEKDPGNQLWWVDRTGKAEFAANTGRATGPVSLSPDGQRAALVADETNATIWTCDLVQNTMRRFASGWDNLGPVWTPDGRRITFSSNRDTDGAFFNLYSQSTDGGAPAERLIPRTERGQIPIMGSPDGRTLLFGEASFTEGPFLMLFSRESGAVTRFIDRRTQRGHEAAAISPDGQWIAHLVDDAGEIGPYVSKFPGGSPTWQVSSDNSWRPRWAPSGREVYYLHDNQMTVVDIATTPQFAVGKPRVLFDAISDEFDLSPNGERFLFAKQIDDRALSEVNLVENWSQELTRLVGSR